MHSPAALWPAIRLSLIMSLIHSWTTMQIDFAQACPQAPMLHQQFVELPKGADISHNPDECIFEVRKNVCGGKDVGRQ